MALLLLLFSGLVGADLRNLEGQLADPHLLRALQDGHEEARRPDEAGGAGARSGGG